MRCSSFRSAAFQVQTVTLTHWLESLLSHWCQAALCYPSIYSLAPCELINRLIHVTTAGRHLFSISHAQVPSCARKEKNRKKQTVCSSTEPDLRIKTWIFSGESGWLSTARLLLFFLVYGRWKCKWTLQNETQWRLGPLSHDDFRWTYIQVDNLWTYMKCNTKYKKVKKKCIK